MYKICMNMNNEIIGVNLQNSNNFINLFNIDFSKTITENKIIQSIDNLGRKLYKETNKQTGKSNITYAFNDINNFIYEPITFECPIQTNYNFQSNIEKFNYKDIINEKRNQLIDKFNCTDCILYEFIENQNIFNCNSGKNVLLIDHEIISEKISLSDVNKIYIYVEGNVNIQISNDEKKWKNIDSDFIDFNYKKLYIKLNCENTERIYSLAILIK